MGVQQVIILLVWCSMTRPRSERDWKDTSGTILGLYPVQANRNSLDAFIRRNELVLLLCLARLIIKMYCLDVPMSDSILRLDSVVVFASWCISNSALSLIFVINK